MKIERVEQLKNRDKYRDLFLLGDEDENMLDKYFYQGHMFLLFDNGLRGGIIVVEKNSISLEIKNISIYPEFQRQGYGKRLVNYVDRKYEKDYEKLLVGTGDSPLTLPFYRALGFKKYFVMKDFFSKNYSEEIYEDGVLLRDMIYLDKNI